MGVNTFSGALTIPAPGTLGNVVGAGSDGVLYGTITPTDPSKALLKSLAQPCLCITDDGGLYVNETTPANEATADDVEIVGTTIATGDAIYVGHATLQAEAIDFEITTQGNYTTTTFTFKYWNGTAWTALSGVTDGTTAFEAATGRAVLSFTTPSDWAKNTVDGVLGYWVQIECSATGGSTTPCQIGQIWWVVQAADGTWTDDTTDFTDAGTDDAAALPARPHVGDGLYVGYSEKFAKMKVTVGQARTGTATLALKYWDGSAWTAITAANVEDDSAGWSTGTSTYIISFIPPSDWTANTAANGPNGETGYFVTMEMTAITDVTQQPLITQGWVLPFTTNVTGVPSPDDGTVSKVTCNALTASGSNADSKFVLLNATKGTFISFTWTKAVATVVVSSLSLQVSKGDELVLLQITEDGSTEFAEASFLLEIT